MTKAVSKENQEPVVKSLEEMTDAEIDTACSEELQAVLVKYGRGLMPYNEPRVRLFKPETDATAKD